MAQLPAGTVTFLFSDIEGSTRLLQRLGSDYARVLGEHQTLLRAAFAAHDGVEVDTQGDAFFIAFPSAPQAMAAAVAATRALVAHPWPEAEGTTLAVRIGLHTGAPQVVGDHYVGLDVHRAARIAAAGHGGQILLSEATRALVAQDLPADISLRDLGAHRLKDLQQPERIYQLVVNGLLADFPALKALDARPQNLPVQPTLLLGREREVTEVSGLLRRNDLRLVTLTGPGGIGKTRLSLQVATELLDAFSDGVWNVRLSRLSDPVLVLPTIAQVFELKEIGATPVSTLLQTYLCDKRLLLVLDNFEQVAVAAPAVGELLAACRGVKALVTSRVPLHLRGERDYALHPLALPDPAQLPPLERLSQYAAVALFIERAQAAQADFQVTQQNAPAVAEICTRLDGLPLAIELAARRVKLLPPAALLQRLERSLPLLTGGTRDVDARQQTMRATLTWSYDLLTPEEQRLFRRLAVFVGGWTLDAAEAVCVAPEGAEPLGLDLLEGLSQLVDHNLVQLQEDGEGEPRFGMLHVIREYALEQLELDDEIRVLREAHATYFLTRTQHMIHVASTSPQRRRESRHALRRERDNLRALLAWTCTVGNRGTGLRLMAVLGSFWINYWHASEARTWANRLLERKQESNGAESDRAELSWVATLDAWVQLSSELAQQNLPRIRSSWTIPDSLDIPDHEETDARIELAMQAGIWAFFQDDYRQAATHVLSGFEWARAAGDGKHVGEAVAALGWCAMGQGDLEHGIALVDNGIALLRQLGTTVVLSPTLANYSYFLFTFAADEERASALATEAFALSRQEENIYAQSTAAIVLAMVAARRQALEHAHTLAHEALVWVWANEEEFLVPNCFLALAVIAAHAGKSKRTAYLVGAAHTLTEQSGIALSDWKAPLIASCIAKAQAALGEEAWLAAYVAGRALSLEEAIAKALGEDVNDN